MEQLTRIKKPSPFKYTIHYTLYTPLHITRIFTHIMQINSLPRNPNTETKSAIFSTLIAVISIGCLLLQEERTPETVTSRLLPTTML
jgi:hypothetical protein